MARHAAYDRPAALASALNLFWERGFHATSIRNLEGALDMRPGSIYAAFGSKEQLFMEALQLYAQAMRQRLRATIATSVSPLQALADYVRSLGSDLQDDMPSKACMLAKTVLESTKKEGALHAAAASALHDTELDMAALFEQAVQRGELPPRADPRRLARQVQASIIGLRVYAQRVGAQPAVVELADDIAATIEGMRRVEPQGEKIEGSK